MNMAKIIRIQDRLQAAFENRMKAEGIEIPSETIKITQLHDPFTISVEDEDTLNKIKDALRGAPILDKKIDIKEHKRKFGRY